MPRPRKLYPVFVDLAGKDVLLVGGGAVAERKARELVAAGASVRVVAKDGSEGLVKLATAGDVAWAERAFDERDVDGSWLVVAATDRPDVQKAVARAAERARIFCIAVDDPENASAYGGSRVSRGSLTIAVSTAGEAPALARLLREVLEGFLPEERWIAAAKELRSRWKRERTPMERRFAELIGEFYERTQTTEAAPLPVRPRRRPQATAKKAEAKKAPSTKKVAKATKKAAKKVRSPRAASEKAPAAERRRRR